MNARKWSLLAGVTVAAALLLGTELATASMQTTTIELAPPIPEGGPSPSYPYVFYSNTVWINVDPEAQITLSGTPDTLSDLRTDDEVRIEVIRPDGTTAVYEHVYGYPENWGQVVPTPPVDLSSLFQVGVNQVNIELIDNIACCYSNWGDYLVGEGFSDDLPKRPVILLPGTYASMNWDCFLFEVDCSDPNKWGWTFGEQAAQFYNPLIEKFNAANYTGSYLTVFFYDWRKPLEFNAEKLKELIMLVKDQAGAPRVDLVGHSMGGLVARSYIQGADYQNDVEHLITLGSPHYGAAQSYPYWEAATFYRVDPGPYAVFITLLQYYMIKQGDMRASVVFRQKIPGARDILPTLDYLRDEENGDQLKPESEMIHRNTYLAGLNADLDTLFSRTNISTFAGYGWPTPKGFYVYARPAWYPFPWDWDDGIPNWEREPEFLDIDGDGTVMVNSAWLQPPADTQKFPMVKHADLPRNEEVMVAIFRVLGIPPLAPQAQGGPDQSVETNDQLILLTLNGSADATVTNPLGGVVGPTENTIPDAEYVSNPNDPFKLIIVPVSAEGNYDVKLESQQSGIYELAMLDTFSPIPIVITDTSALWNTTTSQIEPETAVSFVIVYAAATSTTTTIIAVTPIVELPVWAGDVAVRGKALPGVTVEIRDKLTDELLGAGQVDDSGNFNISLSVPLKIDQKIYPRANGAVGVPVIAQGRKTFLPVVTR